MNALRKHITIGTIAVLGCLSLPDASSAQSTWFPLLTAPGDVQMELIGEVINPAPGGSPTTSLQFGYISRINGIDKVFTGTPENETTAIYTFVTHATTIRRTVHGPLVILSREGTTTIYCNNAPKGDFANPDSFSAGTPIQLSTYRQQSVTNTITNTFNTTHANTITSVDTCTDSAGDVHRLGWVGQVWRTRLTGQLNTATPPAPPSGWFAGAVVGLLSIR